MMPLKVQKCPHSEETSSRCSNVLKFCRVFCTLSGCPHRPRPSPRMSPRYRDVLTVQGTSPQGVDVFLISQYPQTAGFFPSHCANAPINPYPQDGKGDPRVAGSAPHRGDVLPMQQRPRTVIPTNLSCPQKKGSPPTAETAFSSPKLRVLTVLRFSK